MTLVKEKEWEKQKQLHQERKQFKKEESSYYGYVVLILVLLFIGVVWWISR